MTIRNKGVLHERMDAPFVGALISAIGCHCGCPGCCNEYLKTDEYNQVPLECIIDSVLQDPFEEGIILAGLEWTEQPEEMQRLISAALGNGLKVILYTHHTEEEIKSMFPSLMHLPIYIKFGAYEEDKTVLNYESYGVPLETSNQYIKYYG